MLPLMLLTPNFVHTHTKEMRVASTISFNMLSCSVVNLHRYGTRSHIGNDSPGGKCDRQLVVSCTVNYEM